MKLRLFIGSSVGGLDVAYAIQENLERDFEVTVWSQGIFELSKTNIEALYEAAQRFDAAVFVFRADDHLTRNNKTEPVVRDNVVFELGLFVGRVGRQKCFIIKPRSETSLHFPTDLLGVVTGDYDDERTDGNIAAALGPASNRIRKALLPPQPPQLKNPKGNDIQSVLVQGAFRLVFNPPNRSKRMRFQPGGRIVEGNNQNEHTWRVVAGMLELLQLDGQVHSRFRFDPKSKKMFDHTNDADTLSTKNQYLVPDD